MQLAKKLSPDWFELPFDDEPTSFLIRPLTAAEKVSIMTMTETADRAGEAMLQTARYAVVDWRNVRDESGQPLTYSVAALDRLFSDERWAPQLIALSTKIAFRASLSEIDRKN